MRNGATLANPETKSTPILETLSEIPPTEGSRSSVAIANAIGGLTTAA